MEISQIEVEGEIDNFNEKIIKALKIFGEFPKNVKVIRRSIKLGKKGLLKSEIIYMING